MEGTDVTDPVPVVEEPEITSASTMGPEPAEKTASASDDSDGGDGSATSCPWSLTHEQQVHNLKDNWKRACDWIFIQFDNELWDPWFERVVTNLRVDPCLDSCKLEIPKSRVGQNYPGFDMNSLHVAILMGDVKMVQKILERSNLQHDKGIRVPKLCLQESWEYTLPKSIFDSLEDIVILYTPLHLAVQCGDSHIVDVLLKNGADVNEQNWFYQTPLDLACKSRRDVTMLEQLLQYDRADGKKPILVAVQHGDIDFMKKLPSQNVNAIDHRGRTPLHYLAATKRFHRLHKVTKIIKYLAEDKALDIKALDHRGYSAFYVAIMHCNTKVVIALLDSFKDQIRLNEACNENMGPPIQIAFEGGAPSRILRAHSWNVILSKATWRSCTEIAKSTWMRPMPFLWVQLSLQASPLLHGCNHP